MNIKFWLLFIGILILATIYIFQTSYGESIGLQLSNSCLIFLTNNLSNNPCPTYEELLFIFSDTSNSKYSGELNYHNKTYIHRDKPFIRNHFQLYKQSDNITWIDPPSDIQRYIKLIIIEPRLDEYKIGNQIINDSSVLVGKDRYTNPNCSISRISSTNWQFLTGDTIRFMGNNCNPEFTNFNSTIKKTWERTLHDFTTSYKYQLDQWFKQSIEKCARSYCIPT